MKKLLRQLIEIPTVTYNCTAMQEFLAAYCLRKGYSHTFDDLGSLYVVKGDSDTYPCIVAHMDTVHHIEEGGIRAVQTGDCVFAVNPVTMHQTGCGGDDKCGIYAALRCLDALPACKAAFFVDEECGCAGSTNADVAFFEDCRFVLQADRRGGNDWVHDICGPLGSDEFQEAVAPYLARHGFAPVLGAMSDVMALRDLRIGASVANMSAGYYNPHSASEYIHIPALENVVALMLAICRGLTSPFPFVYVPAPRTWKRRSTSLLPAPDAIEAVFDTTKWEDDSCGVCGDVHRIEDMHSYGGGCFVCDHCAPFVGI